MSNLPTEKLVITWPEGLADTDETRDAFNDDATTQILDFAKALTARGERAWFEVWYKNFPGYPDTTEEDFDAVEVVDGEITTLPPYSELKKES